MVIETTVLYSRHIYLTDSILLQCDVIVRSLLSGE